MGREVEWLMSFIFNHGFLTKQNQSWRFWKKTIYRKHCLMFCDTGFFSHTHSSIKLPIGPHPTRFIVFLNSESPKPASEYHNWPDSRQKAFTRQHKLSHWIWSITQLPLRPKFQHDSTVTWFKIQMWSWGFIFLSASDEFSVGPQLHSHLNML